MLNFGEIRNVNNPNASVDQGSLNVGLLEVYVLGPLLVVPVGKAEKLVLVNHVKFERNSVIEFMGIRTI